MNPPESNHFRSIFVTIGQVVSELASAFLRDPKIRKFTLYGAAGCLLGAVLGELLFLVKPAQDICIVIDASGSMGGEKLTEVKRAAAGFVERQSFFRNRISIVQFGGAASTLIPLSRDKSGILSAIDRVQDGGSTNMAAAIRTAGSALVGAGDSLRRRLGGSSPYLLLFTDGAPDNAYDTLTAASETRSRGIQIIAIGTGDADRAFLAEVTNDPGVVFAASAGQFDSGFRAAEQAIGSLAASGGRGREGSARCLSLPFGLRCWRRDAELLSRWGRTCISGSDQPSRARLRGCWGRPCSRGSLPAASLNRSTASLASYRRPRSKGPSR